MKATRAYLEALLPALTNGQKIRFQEGKGWQTNIKTRVLTYNPHDLIDHDIDMAKGLLIHEAGHINHTTAGQTTPEYKAHKSIQNVYNVLEDIRIENEQIKTHGDFASEPLNFVNATGLLNKANEPEKLAQQPKLMQYLHGLQTHLIPQALDDISGVLGYGEIYDIQDKVKTAIGQDLSERIHKTLQTTGDIVNKIKQCKNTDEVKQIAHEAILPFCQDLLDEADKMPDEQGMELTQQFGQGYQEPKTRSTKNIPTNSELDALLAPYIDTLSRKLGDILKEKAQVNYYGNYKRGKLLGKNAYKVITGDKRLFSRRNEPDNPNYTITMILDNSGSMGSGVKHTGAFIGSYLLDKTCKKLGFKVNLIGMDNQATTLSGIDDYRQITGGGNDEENALEHTRTMLDKTDENLVFLLTDGLACSNPQAIIKKLTTEYNSKIVAIGIGLTANETQKTREIYPISMQAKRPEELSTVMISTMQRLITR